MNNADWLARSLAAVWHPCTQMKQHETLPLLPIKRAAGAWLYDYDGHRCLDAVSSWWVNLFGHCNPRINAAIVEQLGQLEHVMLAGFTHRPAIELAERLAALTGLGHAFFGSDGASATEIALKMSFHYWRNRGQPEKSGFLSLANGYHGETLGALGVTDIALFRDTYAPLLRHHAQLPSPDWRLAPAGTSAREWAHHCADLAAQQLQAVHRQIAAIIVEPLVQGAVGMAMYHPDYLSRLRALCDHYQIHLIADEIAVGFGRTGSLFACEQANIQADLLCLSKGLTGGYLPLSAVLCRDDIYQAFYSDDLRRGFLHSHSYTGNALACTAALAVLDIFATEGVLERNRSTASRLNDLLQPAQAHPRARHWRQTGMIWAFDVPDARPGFAGRCFTRALERGVLVRPIGNTVYFMPPYILEDHELQLLADCALSLLDEVA